MKVRKIKKITKNYKMTMKEIEISTPIQGWMVWDILDLIHFITSFEMIYDIPKIDSYNHNYTL